MRTPPGNVPKGFGRLRYIHTTKVKATLREVAAFHHNSLALKKLSPPGIIIQLNKVEPISEGSITDFTMWLGPIPVHWIALHSEISPRGFSDLQASGPFKYWKHSHTYNEIDHQTCEIVDEIRAEIGEHWFWGWVSRSMWLGLPLLFAYRGWATRHFLENADR